MNCNRTESMLALFVMFSMVLQSGSALKAADVVVTFDLQLADNNNAGGGGTWSLFGRIDNPTTGVDGTIGLAGIDAIINGIDFGTDGDAISLSTTIGAINPIQTAGGPIFPALDLGGGTVDLIYGQNISIGQTTGVGVNNTAGLLDTLIAFGTYSGAAPTFTTNDGFPTDANLLTSASSPFTSDRADSVTTKVITLGDTTGDGLVTLLDIQPFVDQVALGSSSSDAALASDLDQSGLVTLVDIQPFVDLLAGTSSAVSTSIPEPSTGLLLLVGSLAWGGFRRFRVFANPLEVGV